MLPGKTYTIEDYLRILWRRKWFLLIPVALIGATTALVTWRLPNRYRSTAVMEVVPQRVPSDYVQPTVTSSPEQRLSSLQQQILSRTRLEQLISEFNLYPEQRQNGIMEDVVQRMRDADISIGIPERNQAAFSISYVGDNPQTVMRVTERLASMVMDENLKDRARLAEGTDQFLETQLQDARTRLVEQEKRLEAYRRQHAGELPSQASSNLQAVQNAQLQVQSLVQSIAQDRDRKFMLERMLADASLVEVASAATPSTFSAASAGVTAPLTTAQQLEGARAALKEMQQRFTPEHPDVVKLRRTVAALEQRAEKEALEVPLAVDPSAEETPATSPLEAARMARVRSTKLELESLDRQIAQKQAEETRLRGVIADYQGRLAAVPTRESELMELTRDHSTLLQLYTNLLAKKENARMAMNMERRNIGEQFRLVDPARIPERPFSPNRPQLYSMGLIGGLAVGVLLVFVLEYRDTSVRSESDVVSVLGLPVLAMVPMMTTAAERRRTKIRRRLVSASAATTVFAGAAVVLWVVLR